MNLENRKLQKQKRKSSPTIEQAIEKKKDYQQHSNGKQEKKGKTIRKNK